MSAADAVEVAAKLPVVKAWTESLGQLSENGSNNHYHFKAPLNVPGFYLITTRVRYAPVIAVTQLAVVAEKVLTWASPEGVMFRVVDRENGQPVAKARLRGQIEPHYDHAKIAPQFFDGSRSENFRGGFAIGFNTGKRDELATSNDDFLLGFSEGLKLRDKYPLAPESFEVKTAGDGTAYLALPQKWNGVACEVAATLNELGEVCPVKVMCARPGDSKRWQALFYAERPIFNRAKKCA